MRPALTKNLVASQAFLICGLWPASVYAAEVTLSTAWLKIPFAAWVVVFFLSTIFGLGSLLNRLKAETPARLKLYIASQMVSSWLAGVLAFWIAESAGWSGLSQTIAIALASYLGATFIDKITVDWLNRFPGVSNAADPKAPGQ